MATTVVTSRIRDVSTSVNIGACRCAWRVTVAVRAVGSTRADRLSLPASILYTVDITSERGSVCEWNKCTLINCHVKNKIVRSNKLQQFFLYFSTFIFKILFYSKKLQYFNFQYRNPSSSCYEPEPTPRISEERNCRVLKQGKNCYRLIGLGILSRPSLNHVTNTGLVI